MMLGKLNKKAVSIMVGYVLLVTIAIIIGALVYGWMKSYVPVDAIECPDGVSVFIDEISCTNNDATFNLDFTLKNNGRFDVAGYFIRATTSPEQEIATKNLIEFLESGGEKLGETVIFVKGDDNYMKAGDVEIGSFENIDEEIYAVEITPIRFQEENNRIKLAVCGNAKVSEKLNCASA